MTTAGTSRSHLYDIQTFKEASTSRLKFLYSDFSRQKQSNPASFSSNVEWWRRTLETLVLKGWQSQTPTAPTNPDRLVFHAVGPQVTEQFRVEGAGKPLGLSAVIVSTLNVECMINWSIEFTNALLGKSELCYIKAFFPLAQFRTSTQSIYNPGWLPYRIASFVIGKPLWWTLQQLSIVSSDDAGGSESDAQRWKKVKGDYVVVGLLEQAAEAVLQHQESGSSLADSLYDFDGFKREFGTCAFEGLELSNLDIKVLVKFLERDRQAIVVQRGVSGHSSIRRSLK